ncbi:MAG: hypothetical protein OEZ22_00150 [Spirochaetia bacterium]|nr:hypothetical protein [Spirochaetia bacterium]
MESYEEDIAGNLAAGNYNRAWQLAEVNLKSFPIDKKNSRQYKEAEEAYIFSKFFFHRQERIKLTPNNYERARLFVDFLREVDEIRKEKDFSLYSENSILPVVYHIIHVHIADGFAKAFAGQKTFQLNQEEIIQLAISLIEIKNWQSAKDSLLFMLKANPKHAIYNFLLSFVCFQNKEEENFLIYLREALFINPDIIKNYKKYLPDGIFQNIWENIENQNYSENIKYRYYALLLEAHGLFSKKKEITNRELKKIEEDFEKLYNQFQSSANSTIISEIKPRIMHFLCWLIYYFSQFNIVSSVERYKSILKNLDSEIYKLFIDNNSL